MKELGRLEILDAVRNSIDAGKPYLGICLGLQILFTESEEFGACSGIDIFRGKVERFRPEDSALKIPHMGWNTIKLKKENPLYAGIPDESYFYFVHSYYVAPEDADIVATSTCYGAEFVSSVWKDNVFAVQFHPEKSQALGLRMLRNFGEIVGRSS
jgi:glutamine amidotransferase